jgi:hypothetical protein
MNALSKIACALLMGTVFNANATVYSTTATGTVAKVYSGDSSLFVDVMGFTPQVGQSYVETISITTPSAIAANPTSASYVAQEDGVISVSFTVDGVTKTLSSTTATGAIRYFSEPGRDNYQITAEIRDANYNHWGFSIYAGAYGNQNMWDSADPSKNYFFNPNQLAGGGPSIGVRVNDSDFFFGGGLDGSGGTLSISAVPEPGTYNMMLAGLVLLGVVTRRHKKQSDSFFVN